MPGHHGYRRPGVVRVAPGGLGLRRWRGLRPAGLVVACRRAAGACARRAGPPGAARARRATSPRAARRPRAARAAARRRSSRRADAVGQHAAAAATWPAGGVVSPKISSGPWRTRDHEPALLRLRTSMSRRRSSAGAAPATPRRRSACPRRQALGGQRALEPDHRQRRSPRQARAARAVGVHRHPLPRRHAHRGRPVLDHVDPQPVREVGVTSSARRADSRPPPAGARSRSTWRVLMVARPRVERGAQSRRVAAQAGHRHVLHRERPESRNQNM